MAVVKGLASIKRHQAEQEARKKSGDFPEFLYRIFPKVVGNEIVVRFLQELDAGMKNYREDRGIGFIAVEHQAGAPDKDSEKPQRGFMYKAECTIDDEDEKCFGCEKHKENYKGGWNIAQNLYVNVLVEVDGEKKVYILSRNANSSFVQSLIAEYEDEESITDANYRITKTGDGTNTNWLLKRLKSEPLDDTDAKLWDLEGQVIKKVPYVDQVKFYSQAYPKVDENGPSAEKASRPAPAPDEEW
jgi:hypothetical protein